jgi:hypothetical protein
MLNGLNSYTPWLALYYPLFAMIDPRKGTMTRMQDYLTSLRKSCLLVRTRCQSKRLWCQSKINISIRIIVSNEAEVPFFCCSCDLCLYNRHPFRSNHVARVLLPRQRYSRIDVCLWMRWKYSFSIYNRHDDIEIESLQPLCV